MCRYCKEDCYKIYKPKIVALMKHYGCTGYLIGPGGFNFKFGNIDVGVGEHYCHKDQYFECKRRFEKHLTNK